MRAITKPYDINSLGKLNEWLAECGMPQRDCEDSEIGGPEDREANLMFASRTFVVGDKSSVNECYDQLFADAASGLYELFIFMDGKRVVWRSQPQISEVEMRQWARMPGARVSLDSDGCRSLTKIEGKCRAMFIARFWCEAVTVVPSK